MSPPVLKTKLFLPPLQSRMVARPRLVQRLEQSLLSGIRLVLVAAPAGFGKTTAISSWVHQHVHPVAWLSLDEQDNDPAVFWSYVIAAIQTIRPDFGYQFYEDLNSSLPAPAESILPAFVNELVELPQPVTLVLDDYHVISNQEVHASLVFLLEHQPPQFHLVGDPQAARALVQDMPNAQVEVVNAGHLMAAELPDETNRLILDFFRETPSNKPPCLNRQAP